MRSASSRPKYVDGNLDTAKMSHGTISGLGPAWATDSAYYDP